MAYIHIAGIIIGVLIVIYILTRNTYSGGKKAGYTLIVAILLGGFHNVYKTQSGDIYRETLLSMPLFAAINQLEPALFDKSYTLIRTLKAKGDSENMMSSPEVAAFYAQVTQWVNENLATLLHNAPDEAVLMYARKQNEQLKKILDLDKSGELCFNLLYPGVVAQPDLAKLNSIIGQLAGEQKERTWLNLVADAAARNEKPSHLPLADVEQAYADAWYAAFAPFGDGFMENPDIRRYSDRPRDVCEANIQLNKAALDQDPHMAAEIIRYMYSD